MQIGLGSYSFRWAIGTPTFQPARPLTPFDLVSRTANLGCTLLQIADNAMLDSFTSAQLTELKLHAKNQGVTLEVGTSGATQARIMRYLEIAVSLDSRLVRLVLDGPDAHPTLSEARDLLRRVAPAYKDAGVVLAIENHFLIPSTQLAGLIKEVADPAVGVCLDLANSIACLEWPAETVRILSPYALNVHMKDFQIAPHPEGVGVTVSGVPLGAGRQDFPGLLKAIPCRQQVNFILEQWLPRQSSEQATLQLEMAWIKQSLTTARQLLNLPG